MALIFTDEQLKKITNDIIGLPVVIQSHIDDKADLLTQQADLLKEDNANKIYSDNYIGIIQAYHDELQNINGVNRSEYAESYIQDGPKKLNGHFPPSSPNYIPILLPQNNGNPIVNLPDYETLKLAEVKSFMTLLKTGFTDGALEDTLSEPYVIGQPVILTVGGFSNGQRVVIDQGGQSLIAIVVSAGATSGTCSIPEHLTEAACLAALPTPGIWTPASGAESLTLNVLSDPNVVLGTGARIRNYHAGFTNSEREGTSSPYAPQVLTYWGSQLDAKVALWKVFVQAIQTALNSNDATGAEATEKATYLQLATDTLASINSFQAAPLTGLGVGRYGDTVMGGLEVYVDQRIADLPTRAANIVTYLGSVSQAGDFIYSGNGQYFNLWKWVDLRINVAGGSLSRYLQVGEGVAFFDNAIATAQNQKTEYDATFIVKQFNGNGDGTKFVTLLDVTGLSVSDAVSLMDNDSLVYARTIVDIQGNVVELDTAIGVNLLTTKLARLVKRI
ncbi:hypothetical protein MASR1M48_17530 [Lactococcus petauri]